MDAPAVEYVTTSDGYNIAYGVSGVGVPVIYAAGAMPHVQLGWQYEPMRPWLEGLASRYQLVQFDIRGCGLSTRGLLPTHKLEDVVLDLEAVVGRLGLDRFVLYGVGGPTHSFVKYALKHPERVRGLIMSGRGVNFQAQTSPNLYTVTSQDLDTFFYSMAPRDWSADQRRAAVELQKQCVTQQDFVTMTRTLAAEGNHEPFLRRLSVPTLILHARDFFMVTAEQAMKAAQLARGKFVLINGSTTFGDASDGLPHVQQFIAGLPNEADAAEADADILSSREREVLRLIAAGRSNQQIADELVISYNTVQRHVGHILSKTGLANRTEAASYAHRHHLT